MASMFNSTRTINTTASVEQTEASEGLRLARFCSLEELLGLIFDLMTVGWIVMSLVQLA